MIAKYWLIYFCLDCCRCERHCEFMKFSKWVYLNVWKITCKKRAKNWVAFIKYILSCFCHKFHSQMGFPKEREEKKPTNHIKFPNYSHLNELIICAFIVLSVRCFLSILMSLNSLPLHWKLIRDVKLRSLYNNTFNSKTHTHSLIQSVKCIWLHFDCHNFF